MSFSRVVSAAGVLVVLVAPAAAQIKTIPGEHHTITATVEAIEQSSRELTLRDTEGQVRTIRVPDEVKRFPAMRVGDTITFTYYDTISLRKKAPGEPDVDTVSSGVTPGGGRKPVGTAAAQMTITATIDAIDRNVPSISFKGPRGWQYSTRVQDTQALAQVKVGDKVDITWTEALLVEVTDRKQ